MAEVDAKTDREKVEAAVGAYRAGGLGVVGPDATLLALTNGQVDELLITASLAIARRPAWHARRGDGDRQRRRHRGARGRTVDAAGEPARAEMGTVRLADELVTKAHQTAARICSSRIRRCWSGTAGWPRLSATGFRRATPRIGDDRGHDRSDRRRATMMTPTTAWKAGVFIHRRIWLPYRYASAPSTPKRNSRAPASAREERPRVHARARR